MSHQILGLHHVTATVDDAQADLDFCVDGLGLRIVKKTVNFDNHGVYHFYYGTERGAPGTIWTTFPYKGRGVRVGTKGAGQVTATSFSVPAGSLRFWKSWLADRGVAATSAMPRFGEESLAVDDPSGLRFELVATDRDSRSPWIAGGIEPEHAIRGLHSVTLTVRSPDETVKFLSGLLGFQVADKTAARTRVAVSGGAAGQTLDVVADPNAEPAVNGLGTVHHVAMAIASEDEQQRLREELVARGIQVTPVMDRCYFRSIYFREPGGVLLEVATVEPGFLVDEELPTLGRNLKLPPWEEPHRPAIEAQLPKVEYR